MELTEAYRECERITWTQARNFAYGIRLLPADKRRGLAVIYAFARRIDDIGDGTLPPEEKIAIAVNDEGGHAIAGELPQRCAHLILGRVRVIITHPAFKEVAENVERVGTAGAKCEKVDELRAGRRLAGIQMQIGDEQGSQGGSLGADS